MTSCLQSDDWGCLGSVETCGEQILGLTALNQQAVVLNEDIIVSSIAALAQPQRRRTKSSVSMVE
jgi:hypothetical protein